MPSRLTVVVVSLLMATPVVMFWFWLVMLPVRTELICPEECRCDLDGLFVNCSGSELNSIPLNISTYVRKLVLDGNRITFFENDSFVSRGLVELEILQADFCKLRKIELEAFNGLTMLKQLSMLGNNISEIIPGTFEKMSRLENLRLDHNRIDQLDSNTVYGLVNLKNLSLEGNILQYLLPDTFVELPNLQNLVLGNNTGLQVPTDHNFINSNSLKHLGIYDCNVSSVSFETFANVSTLESLDLSYNYLRNLDINILKVLSELSELKLEHNKISEIIPGTFQKNSSLEFLYLGNNFIQHVEIGVFSGLVNLKILSLDGNKLQDLHPGTFVGLRKFKRLNLSNNPGLLIPTDRQFINSHSLPVLVISGCNMSSVSVETFANVRALEELDLRENNLSRVDINILKALPYLSALYLNFNPLQCDCQLQEVWRLCKDHNIQTAYKEFAPECDTPSEVKGMWWGVLEKGQCLDGNIQYYGDYKNTSYSYTPTEDTDTEIQEPDSFFGFVKQYKLPISATLFVFGTTGNVILIIIISCNKDMRTVPNMYILNLSISDIIYLIAVISDIWPNYLPQLRDFMMCIFITFCYRMAVGLTAYSIAVLSIQRYRVIVNPLHVRVSSQPTWRSTGATICGVWIAAALSAVPEVRSTSCCGEITVFRITNYFRYVVIFDLLVTFVIPLCLIAFSYVMTSSHLVKDSGVLSERTHKPQLNTRKITATVLLGLIIVFLISYLPYHIWKTFLIFNNNFYIADFSFIVEPDLLNVFRDIDTITYFLLLINSCLNPLALFCTSLAFRRQFKRYLTCRCKTNSPSH
jgi:Leucine-rich repeat (LRR) protein